MCSGQTELVSSVFQLLMLRTPPLQQYSGFLYSETSLENYLFYFIRFEMLNFSVYVVHIFEILYFDLRNY